MKQLIYYMKLTDGTELIGITRNEAVEKINNHFKDVKYYKPITISVLDRLIMNENSNAYIDEAYKKPINEYYKTEIDLFITNDKKQRTEDAMKKAINRYVNKLYYGNLIVKQENIKTEKEVKTIKTDIIDSKDNVKTIINANMDSKDKVETDKEIKTNDLISEDIELIKETIKECVKTIEEPIKHDEKTNHLISEDIEPIKDYHGEEEKDKKTIEEQIKQDEKTNHLISEDIEPIKKDEKTIEEQIKQDEKTIEEQIKQDEKTTDLISEDIEPIKDYDRNEEEVFIVESLKNIFKNQDKDINDIMYNASLNSNMGLLWNDGGDKNINNKNIKKLNPVHKTTSNKTTLKWGGRKKHNYTTKQPHLLKEQLKKLKENNNSNK